METRKRRISFALVECHVATVIEGGAFVGWEIGMGGGRKFGNRKLDVVTEEVLREKQS